MGRSIFDIQDDITGLGRVLPYLEEGEDGTEELEKFFAGLQVEREKKLDAYALLIQEFIAKSEFRKAEAKRISELAKTDENMAKRLKERLKTYLESIGVTKTETPLHKFWIQKNGTVPVECSRDDFGEEDAKKWPFIEVKYSFKSDEFVSFLNKKVCEREQFVENGELSEEAAQKWYEKQVPDFAKLGVRGTHLRVK